MKKEYNNLFLLTYQVRLKRLLCLDEKIFKLKEMKEEKKKRFEISGLQFL